MSYDVTVRDKEFGYTFNLYRFFTDFGTNPNSWDGKTYQEVSDQISNSLADIRSHALRDLEREYSPENGWGSVSGAIRFLEEVKAECDRVPPERVRVS